MAERQRHSGAHKEPPAVIREIGGYITIPAAAKRLGVTPARLRWIARQRPDRMNAVKLEGRWLVPVEAVDHYRDIDPRLLRPRRRRPWTLRGVSVPQPWATDLLDGKLTQVTQRRGTSHRGLTLLHASVAPDNDELGRRPHQPRYDERGAFVGAFELLDAVRTTDGYDWLVAEPRPLPFPIPYQGWGGAFSVAGPARRMALRMLGVDPES